MVTTLPALPATTLPSIAGYTVRPITLDDAQAWASYVCMPQVMEHTSSTARTAEDLLPMIERILAGSADSPIRFVLQPPGSTATVLANVRSQRVLERCGYLREGVVRNFRVVRGLPADYCMYSAISGDMERAG